MTQVRNGVSREGLIRPGCWDPHRLPNYSENELNDFGALLTKPKRWSTSLSTTRKFHFRQSTKQKIRLCTYILQRHSQLITALSIRKPPCDHQQGYTQINYGMVTADCHGARRNRLWRSRAISTVGTKPLTEKTQLYEVCIMWLYLCEQQIHQNQRLFTEFYVEKLHE